MLGASQGIKEEAIQQYDHWCGVADYHPKIYLDKQLPPPTMPLTDGIGKYEGCKMYNDVVVYKSDGSSTYAAHDLSFAEIAKPDFYLTGEEQKGHFQSLGMGHKHLPLGLLLGSDGQKMKSTIKTEDDAVNFVSAMNLFLAVKGSLKPTPDSDALAWNVLAWQFNSAAVHKATTLNIEMWCSIGGPGVYITYTYAKMMKALSNAKNVPDEHAMTLEDAELAGFASYFHYYWQKAIDEKQPYYVAGGALWLAQKLSEVYAENNIQSAEPGLLFAITYAVETLKHCMQLLGMKPLLQV